MSAGEPLLDVVIACHDERRPIERAVASVLHDPEARAAVRVTVVAHGLPIEVFEKRLAAALGTAPEAHKVPEVPEDTGTPNEPETSKPHDSSSSAPTTPTETQHGATAQVQDVTTARWRVEAFSDGVRSAAGPFNRGLDLATARYVMVMGSDDYLEPGAMVAWLAHVRREGSAAAIVPIRMQGGPVLPNPLVRLGRTRRLDAVKDRLFYRTAPLALVARAEIERLGLRMTEGVRVSEDLDFGVRLWAFGGRIDYLADSPSYVIGSDVADRTTLAPLSVEQSFEAVVRLLDGPVPAHLSLPQRRAFAIKLTRIAVLGLVRSRPSPAAWGGDEEVTLLARILRRLLALAPGVLAPFNRADRRILDGLLVESTTRRVAADAAPRSGAASRLQSWLTANPWLSLGRETTLRRYLIMKLRRQQL